MIIRQDCFFSYDDLMEISPKTRLMMILDEIDVSPVASAKKSTRNQRTQRLPQRKASGV
jgi:hypothetical protein